MVTLCTYNMHEFTIQLKVKHKGLNTKFINIFNKNCQIQIGRKVKHKERNTKSTNKFNKKLSNSDRNVPNYFITQLNFSNIYLNALKLNTYAEVPFSRSAVISALKTK